MFNKTLLAAMALAGAQAIDISSQSQTELLSYTNDEDFGDWEADEFWEAYRECAFHGDYDGLFECISEYFDDGDDMEADRGMLAQTSTQNWRDWATSESW